MTIQRGKDLLNQSQPNVDDLQKSIAALKQEKKYVENCIEIGFREKSSGETVVGEIAELITQLEEKLECLTN
jgi:chemotaxis regulatin CheY-phosphate phosphatase CheZ